MQVGFQIDSVTYRIHHAQTQMHFLNIDSSATIEGVEPLDGRVNFLVGMNAANWKTGIETYRRLVYRGLYPGIDASYGCQNGALESEFVVAPSSSAAQIRLRYENATRVSIEPNGDLDS